MAPAEFIGTETKRFYEVQDLVQDFMHCSTHLLDPQSKLILHDSKTFKMFGRVSQPTWPPAYDCPGAFADFKNTFETLFGQQLVRTFEHDIACEGPAQKAFWTTFDRMLRGQEELESELTDICTCAEEGPEWTSIPSDIDQRICMGDMVDNAFSGECSGWKEKDRRAYQEKRHKLQPPGLGKSIGASKAKAMAAKAQAPAARARATAATGHRRAMLASLACPLHRASARLPGCPPLVNKPPPAWQVAAPVWSMCLAPRVFKMVLKCRFAHQAHGLLPETFNADTAVSTVTELVTFRRRRRRVPAG